MADDVAYHRSLNYVHPDAYRGGQHTVKAYTWVENYGSHELAQYAGVSNLKKDQDFEKYATKFEKDFSGALGKGSDPVVDDALTVVGYHRRFGGHLIWMPRSAPQTLKFRTWEKDDPVAPYSPMH